MSDTTTMFTKKASKLENQTVDTAINEPKKPRFFWLPLKEQIMYAKRLSILIKAGVPIVRSLKMIESQGKTKTAKYIFHRLVDTVEKGGYLAAGMNKFRRVFGDFAVNVVEIGEHSGTLQENLHYLSEELQKKQALRRKVRGAMVYPAFVVFATIGIVLMLMTYVFPKVLPIFASLNFELPITTKILIAVSNFMIHQWFFLLLGIAILAGVVYLLFRNFKLRFKLHGYVLKIPIFGNLIQSYYVANITRTLGLLLKSNVPIIKAVNITKNTVTNLQYQDSLEQLQQRLSHGETVSENLMLYPKLYPDVASQMVSIGETTGNLNGTLLFLANMYEDEVDDLTKNLTTLLEPILLVFMGILVGFIAISIITPIYNVTQNIHP